MDFENKRDVIIHELETMSEKETIERNFFKVRAYRKVIDQISKIENVKTMNDLRNVSGIGEKIRKKIEEILLTGELTSAKKARIAVKNMELYSQLMSIHGIGVVKAEELINIHKIKSIDDLIEQLKEMPNILNEKQKLGLQYYKDLQLRIPRKEIDRHGKLLKRFAKTVDPHIEIKLVGSWRRGSDESGDIDVIFTINKESRKKLNNKLQDNKNEEAYKRLFKKFTEMLREKKYLLADLGSGIKKYMGIAKLNKKSDIARRIDILYTSKHEFPFAMLYFTGDFDINVEMRKRARELGYILSEYGLQKLPDKTYLYLSSEREIFNFLGYKFLQPKNRQIKNLKLIK